MATEHQPIRRTGRVRRAAMVCAVFGLPAMLAACGTSVPGKDTFGRIVNAGRPEPEVIDPNLLTANTVCPPVTILPDTESLRRDGGSDDPSRLRWQASITKTARECTPTGEGVTVRVGVSGRVIEGGGGAPGAVELPLRIAVRENGEVTYSRLHSVSVTRTGPSQDWAYVDDALVVKDPKNAEVVVGFDG